MRKTRFVLQWIVFMVVLFLVSMAILRMYTVFKYDEPALHIQRNFLEAIECAKEAGFIFITPTIRQMYYGDDSADGRAYMSVNVIVVKNYASVKTIRHEIGHIIDFQSFGRRTHPAFEKIKHQHIQQFAESIAEIIAEQCNDRQ